MAYTRVNWKDAPGDKTTPLNAANLNQMDEGIAANASDISSLTTNFNNYKEDMSQMTVSGTLAAGATSIELAHSSITNDSIIDPYFFVDGETEPISYKTIKQETGKVTMTFDSRDAAITVGIVVR